MTRTGCVSSLGSVREGKNKKFEDYEKYGIESWRFDTTSSKTVTLDSVKLSTWRETSM